MSKNNEKNSNTIRNPRTEADSKITALRAATAAVTAAGEKLNSARKAAGEGRSPGHALSNEVELALNGLEVSWLEAQDAERLAQAEATFACDAADRAEGIELAVTCEPVQLSKKLASLIANETRLRDEHAAAVKQAWAFIESAYSAAAELEKLRSGAGLPPPARIPRPPLGNSGAIDRQKLVELLADGGKVSPPTKSNAARIETLRREEVRIRADLERQRLAAEERAAEKADVARRQEAERKRDAQRQREEHEAMTAKYQAEKKRERDLAEAHRARTAG